MITRLPPAALYVLLILATNVAFSTIGPVMLTFVLAGFTLAARDWVHEVLGWKVAAGLVLIGAVLSALLAAPAVALASLVAFVVAESLDLLIYSRIRHRSRPLAVLVSGVVGSAIDSLVFLGIAFGSLDFFAVQMTGKVGATVAAALIVLAVIRFRRRR